MLRFSSILFVFSLFLVSSHWVLVDSLKSPFWSSEINLSCRSTKCKLCHRGATIVEGIFVKDVFHETWNDWPCNWPTHEKSLATSWWQHASSDDPKGRLDSSGICRLRLQDSLRFPWFEEVSVCFYRFVYTEISGLFEVRSKLSIDIRTHSMLLLLLQISIVSTGSNGK